MYGGIYSFIPLGQESSGVKFPIQADFLVQPGREAINYECAWNKWLISEVVDLCKIAIADFKDNEVWRYQYLQCFDFEDKRSEALTKLFKPNLIDPLRSFIAQDHGVPVQDGWARPSEVLVIDENDGAIVSLISYSLFTKEEIAPVFGGAPQFKLIDPNVMEPRSKPFKHANRLDLLNNESFLLQKSSEPNAAGWFRNLYSWLATYPRWIKEGRGKKIEGYWNYQIILDANNKLQEGRNILLPDFQSSISILNEVANTLKGEKPILHPDIIGKAVNDEERKKVRGFLTGYTGVQILDIEKICREALLPKILTNSPKPDEEKLLLYSIHCYNILGEGVYEDKEFWVLTKSGDIKAAGEVLFSKEYNPEQDWETNQQFVPGLEFLSSKYLGSGANPDQLEVWRGFFKAGGIKNMPDNGVEVFAEEFTKSILKNKGCRDIVPVDKLHLGYDLRAKDETGAEIYVEVKGLSSEKNIELTGNEVTAGEQYKNSYHLCIVAGIPENHNHYFIKNPVSVGLKEKVTLPVSTWKTGTK